MNATFRRIQLRPLLAAVALLSTTLGSVAQTNLVANGSFESSQLKPGVPDHWAAAGNQAVHQQLLLDAGRDQRHCAKLQCTEFIGDGPDFHAMICQLGQISVRQGQWYRLAFWAKAEGIKSGAVEVGLNCTRPWQNVGLSDVFTPDHHWQQFELLFRAQHDLAASESRLQFWFKGTGTLWLDDLVLTETSNEQQWFPQLATEGVKNFLPNSSFECGAANWGSYTDGLSGWAGNLYRLEGALDTTAAHHGTHSLKMALSPKTLPIYHFDYYEPIRQPVRRVLAANRGWFRVQPGEPLTLSAWLKADADGTPAQLLANQAPDHPLRKQVTVGKDWQRCEFTFRPTQAFLFVAIGLDLEEAKRDAASLWLDEIQLERGEHATAYAPRHPVESFLETDTPGNIFTNSAAGLTFTLRAFNNSDQVQSLKGDLEVTDFFERPAFASPRALAL
ncbi:MAG TPA: hypothetical protein VNT26_20470, partial [Candidatus Sulfotelmatobacter sp.]|nr:hypothetical protein [Candidatus Sulfotelmatobacter sp.]